MSNSMSSVLSVFPEVVRPERDNRIYILEAKSSGVVGDKITIRAEITNSSPRNCKDCDKCFVRTGLCCERCEELMIHLPGVTLIMCRASLGRINHSLRQRKCMVMNEIFNGLKANKKCFTTCDKPAALMIAEVAAAYHHEPPDKSKAIGR